MFEQIEAHVWWVLSGFFAVVLAACLYWKAVPTKSFGLIRRSEQPGTYWISIAILGASLFVGVFVALLSSLPAHLSDLAR